MTLNPGPSARILLLEDSDIDADLLVARLQRGRRAYQIDRAVGRADYEQALFREPADLVLADYSLPDFDGLSALRLAHERWPGVPFVFVSGVLGDDIAMRAVREGATDYVLKRNLASLPAVVERALAEARERTRRERAEVLFRLAAEASGVGVWELDVERQTLRFDDGMRALLGLGPQALPPLPEMIEIVVHPDDREHVKAQLAPVFAPDGKGDFDYTHRALHQRSGRVCWLAVKGRRICGPDNRARLVGTARDVTEERQRDDALRQANHALEERIAERTRERDRIWNLSVDLMVVCRADGELVAVNPAWEHRLGWRSHQLLGTGLGGLVHPDDQAATLHALRSLRDSASLALDNRICHANGSVRWLRWSASADGGLIYAVGRDITDERAAAVELAAAHHALQSQVAERARVEATLQQMQRLEAVGQLTSGVAHDFNNLLAVVLSNINLIRLLVQRQKTPVDERVLQRLESMERASTRGGKLIEQLLAFSRRQRLEPVVMDLNDVLRGMRDLLQTTMGGTVEIRSELQESLWHALVDPTQLELIVLNLAINARDAMQVGGRLTIRTANIELTEPQSRPEEPEPGKYVRLSVTDNGSGIPEAVLPRVFEPFFTTKDVGKGSGLGLAQVYGFAKQSGGGVRIDTRPGEGTTVHVYVPRAEGARAAHAPDGAAAAAAAAPEQLRLLLVDDDDDVREVTAMLLEANGIDVLRATGGAEALSLVERRSDIEAVLADFAMPAMNGAELRRRLHALRPQLPVLIMTGYADLTALDAVEQEMVLKKPLDLDTLLERLRGLKGRRSTPVASHG